ncbi:MAG: cell division protein SepF [Actinomycetota bacterium]
MSMFRKAMVYLGLVDDEEYYGDDEYYGDEPYEEERPPAARGARTSGVTTATVESSSPVTVIRSRRDRDDTGVMAAVRRPTSSVKPVPMPATRVHKIDPRGFNDAQEVGDRLKAGQPVIINLQGVDRDLQRRLIDFSSGLAYALNGTMSKVADQVFLLTPPNVEVSEEEKERLQARGLYRAARA